MKAFIVISCLFASALGGVLEPPALREFRRNPLFPNGKIVGGVDRDISDLPHQVALEYGGSHFCGGTIISEEYILTAAHCMIVQPSILAIRAGSSSRNTGGTVYKVASTVKHGLYNPTTLDYDVAVVKLATKLQITDKSKPIALIDSEPSVSSNFVVSGWGCTKENGQCSPVLKSVDIPIISRHQCNQMYAAYKVPITERMICAYTYGKDSCQGDSGGPAVVNGKIGGIVSFGVGCARPGIAGVYTNVANAAIKSFIRTNANV